MVFVKDNIEKINRILLEGAVVMEFESHIANVDDLDRCAVMESQNSMARFDARFEASISSSAGIARQRQHGDRCVRLSRTSASLEPSIA
jgi:hypothetical protein